MVPSYGLLQVQEDRIPSFRGVGKNDASRPDYSGFQDGLVDWLSDLLGIAEGLRTKRIGGSRPSERTKNRAADARWLYIDLETGFQAAKKFGKPLLVVMSCAPSKASTWIDESVLGAKEHRSPLVSLRR